MPVIVNEIVEESVEGSGLSGSSTGKPYRADVENTGRQIHTRD